jgi:hypothetical protein
MKPRSRLFGFEQVLIGFQPAAMAPSENEAAVRLLDGTVIRGFLSAMLDSPLLN